MKSGLRFQTREVHPTSSLTQMDDRPNSVSFQHARWMPAVDNDLRSVVVVPFDFLTYRRLGALQAEVLGELKRTLVGNKLISEMRNVLLPFPLLYRFIVFSSFPVFL